MLRIRQLLRSQNGNAIVIAAAVMPMLIGAGAVGIDVTNWALSKRQLQRSADSAALAGAFALLWERSAVNAAQRDLQLNNQVPFSSAPIIENAPTVGDYAGRVTAVRVRLSTAPQLTFVSYFMSQSTEIPAEATAAIMPDPRYCMLALERGSTAGIVAFGSSDIRLDCGIGANSQGNPAMAFEGASVVRASSATAVGTVPNVSNLVAPEKASFQPPLGDPFMNLPPASSFATNCGPALVVEANRRANLNPGCWNGMTLKGEVNLRPGTYVVNAADLVIESGAVISGENVTIVLTGTTPTNIAKMSVAGGATLHLGARNSGPLEGVLIYQDSRAVDSINYVSGNSTSKLSGALYFPKQTVQFTGSSTTDTSCMRLVALKIRLGGNNTIGNNCPTSQGLGLFGTRPRLVV